MKRLAALFLLCLPSVALGEDLPQCPAPKNQAPADTAHSAIRIIVSGDNYNDVSGTKAALDLAIAKWNSVCDSNVPKLSKTAQSSIIFNIKFLRGHHPDPRVDICGFVPKPPAGTKLGSTTITIYDELQNGAPCNLLSSYNLITQHEIGHALGLEECATNFGVNLMEGLGLNGPAAAADCQAIDDFWMTEEEELGSPDGDDSNQDNQCVDECGPGGTTPIVISLLDERYELTPYLSGVFFDIDANETVDLTAWTVRGSDDAFLALDRNANGLIDDGSELFGGVTDQPRTAEPPNGFAALAVFDSLESEGNRDGYITSSDAVFELLRLWVDANHNGVSEAGELLTLSDAGIMFLDLAFGESRKVDDYGNEFRYWSLVGREHDIITMWDVILLHVGL